MCCLIYYIISLLWMLETETLNNLLLVMHIYIKFIFYTNGKRKTNKEARHDHEEVSRERERERHRQTHSHDLIWFLSFDKI